MPSSKKRISYALIVKDIAYCRVLQESSSGIFYIDSLFVRESFRKKGIGTNLLKHACFHVGHWPELDIRSVSSVAERIASKLGYELEAVSDRYKGCYLWRNSTKFNLTDPVLGSLSSRTYSNTEKTSNVEYLELNDE